MMRYFIGFIATIGLIIILILLIFHGGSNKAKVPTTAKTLDSYANTNAEAQLTIDGPINAPQNHQQIQISVGQDETTFEQLQGYNGSVVNLQSFTNTEASYSAFLHALTVAGFTDGNTSSSLGDDQGYCPLGSRYIFQLTQNGNNIERFWATNCGNPKTYLGNLNLTLALFQAQVPGYNTLTQNIQDIQY